MQDIRKPYTRSRSNHDLRDRVEQFDRGEYDDDRHYNEEPVTIPTRGQKARRSVDSMEMYPRSRREELYNEESGTFDEREIIDRDPRTRYVSKNHSVRTWLFLLGVFCLVLGIGLLTFVFNSATVTIVPKFQSVDIKRTITLSNSGGGIPYIVATSSITSKKALQATEAKKVESKASGHIIVYNKFSGEPQRLIKNTRFESVDGKIYRISESIIVPGMKGDTPGSVTALVYADNYGADFNTNTADFTIPGFKGTPRYDGFFGRSDGQISGGASGDVSLASLADINAAKDELAIELTQKIKDTLITKKESGFIPLYSTVQVRLIDNEKELLSGKTSSYEVTATGYVLLANELLLGQVLASEVRDYKNEPVYLEDPTAITFTISDQVDLSNATSIKALAEGQTRIVWKTNTEEAKKLFAGKGRGEYKSIISYIPSISAGEISFSPMWLSTFPSDTKKITVIEKLPKK